MKQIRLNKKANEYQNIREKYLGSDSKMATILQSARMNQSEMKQKF